MSLPRYHCATPLYIYYSLLFYSISFFFYWKKDSIAGNRTRGTNVRGLYVTNYTTMDNYSFITLFYFFTFISFFLSTYLSMYLSTYLSMFLTIYPSMYLLYYLFSLFLSVFDFLSFLFMSYFFFSIPIFLYLLFSYPTFFFPTSSVLGSPIFFYYDYYDYYYYLFYF